jgi:hypothetical protein
MAAACNRVGAAGLALAAALTTVTGPGAAAQQSVDQPVYVPREESRIETMPLPPIGGATEDGAPGTSGVGIGRDAGTEPETEPGTLPQPRFLRVPSAVDQNKEAGGAAGVDQGWARSQDGRFHRAPPGAEPEPSAAGAPAPVVPIDPPATDLRAGARLRELDKMTGQTKTFEIAVGETREIDRLRIELDACRSPEGNDMHGNMAFLKVWDTRRPEEAAFSGWMFAESPALSALDHPRYDLWVISCTTSAVATSGPSE